jgi:DNA-binding response OmpR family regulator
LPPPSQQFYRDEHLFVDLRQQRVMLDSETVTLTRMEYRLLALLVKRAGDVVPRPILLKLTGPLDVHLWRLRKKLRQPVHRNDHRDRIPFPAIPAEGLGLPGGYASICTRS